MRTRDIPFRGQRETERYRDRETERERRLSPWRRLASTAYSRGPSRAHNRTETFRKQPHGVPGSTDSRRVCPGYRAGQQAAGRDRRQRPVTNYILLAQSRPRVHLRPGPRPIAPHSRSEAPSPAPLSSTFFSLAPETFQGLNFFFFNLCIGDTSLSQEIQGIIIIIIGKFGILIRLIRFVLFFFLIFVHRCLFLRLLRDSIKDRIVMMIRFYFRGGFFLIFLMLRRGFWRRRLEVRLPHLK